VVVVGRDQDDAAVGFARVVPAHAERRINPDRELQGSVPVQIRARSSDQLKRAVAPDVGLDVDDRGADGRVIVE
jgi:hypothetical protein